MEYHTGALRKRIYQRHESAVSRGVPCGGACASVYAEAPCGAGQGGGFAREQLDSTADNYPQMESRHRFYLSNSFEDWDIQIREGSVTYDVMGVGNKVTVSEYKALMSSRAGRIPIMFFKAYLVEN